MSHTDVKKEHKQLEGDPLIKFSIRSFFNGAKKEKSAEDHNYNVIVTGNNLAVFLLYDKEKLSLPIIKDKIKFFSNDHNKLNAAVINDQALAFDLYKGNLNSPIPRNTLTRVANIYRELASQ